MAIALLAALVCAGAAGTETSVVGRAAYVTMLAAEASRQGIPPALADAVATVESAYDPSAIGASGEIGLMQVMPSTAAMLGFRGTNAELASPQTNIRLGVQYLAGAWIATGGRLCDTLMKYRAGYGEQAMSLRSMTYCRRARDYLASIGSPLASGPGAELPAVTATMQAAGTPRLRPDFMTPAERARMRAGHRTAADEQRFWAREEAYIRSLQTRPDIRRLAMNRSP